MMASTHGVTTPLQAPGLARGGQPDDAGGTNTPVDGRYPLREWVEDALGILAFVLLFPIVILVVGAPVVLLVRLVMALIPG